MKNIIVCKWFNCHNTIESLKNALNYYSVLQLICSDCKEEWFIKDELKYKSMDGTYGYYFNGELLIQEYFSELREALQSAFKLIDVDIDDYPMRRFEHGYIKFDMRTSKSLRGMLGYCALNKKISINLHRHFWYTCSQLSIKFLLSTILHEYVHDILGYFGWEYGHNKTFCKIFKQAFRALFGDLGFSLSTKLWQTRNYKELSKFVFEEFVPMFDKQIEVFQFNPKQS